MSKVVMFVDDDDAYLFFVRRACKKIPIVSTVIESQDGLCGLEELERRVRAADVLPNVVFVDINMPRLDGFGFLEGLHVLRGKYAALQVVRPVAMLTSSDQSSDRERAKALGADAYLVKKDGLAETRDAILAALA